MRRVPSSSSRAPFGVSSHSTRRPCRVEVSRSSEAVRVRACRADFSSTPRAPRASSSVAVHTGSARGCTNSPSTVSSSERALANPTSRRREVAAGCSAMPQVSHRCGPDPGKDMLQTLDVLIVKRRVLPITRCDERCCMTALEESQESQEGPVAVPVVEFDTHPDRYRHWRLSVEGDVATVTLAVDENGGLVEGYALKMNSYDLGVDIELYDAVQRLRFEHPEVKAVVMTGGLEKMFCAGANIRMLAQSPHPWKVNFCKFTNETRNGIEDASAHSGQTYVAALNGTASGGGYELALACEHIMLVDDRSSAVSLPELPLLWVLPGTGGLTRVSDKRKVRRDHADIFCTNQDGVRGQRAKDWRLVDEIVKPQQFSEHVKQRALHLAGQSDRPAAATGVAL